MPETELPTCAIRKYLLNVLLIFVNLATMCTRSLSTLNKHACFLKTPASLEFSDLHFNIIFSEKCNSSTVHLREREREREGERAREREREREREAVYVCMIHRFATFLY